MPMQATAQAQSCPLHDLVAVRDSGRCRNFSTAYSSLSGSKVLRLQGWDVIQKELTLLLRCGNPGLRDSVGPSGNVLSVSGRQFPLEAFQHGIRGHAGSEPRPGYSWIFLLSLPCLGRKWREENCTGSVNVCEREIMHIKHLLYSGHCVQHFAYADPINSLSAPEMPPLSPFTDGNTEVG